MKKLLVLILSLCISSVVYSDHIKNISGRYNKNIECLYGIKYIVFYADHPYHGKLLEVTPFINKETLTFEKCG